MSHSGGRRMFGGQLMRLVKRSPKYTDNTVVFKVAPSMTKHEIKEYLTKLYGLNVKKVNTINYLGKLKRGGAGKSFGRHIYRERDWKKAIVKLADPIQPKVPQ